MFHQTNDAELFLEPDTLKGDDFKLDSNHWRKRKRKCIPLYEAKMFRPYDHRFGTVFEDTSNWINQGQTYETDLVCHQNPEFVVQPRWWVDAEHVVNQLPDPLPPALLVFRDITRSTDVRTFIAAMIPTVGVINTAPLIVPSGLKSRRIACLLGCLNSIPLDFVAKCKTGHIHMNFFIVEQLPVLSPDVYDKPCPWEQSSSLESWISERVLKLTCTAEDMLPLADACEFTGGSFEKEYGGRLNKWDEAERAELMADLDAAFFHLYGLEREDVEYILSTFKGIHDERTLFPGQVSTAQRIVQKFTEMSFPS
jgi:hypothetical protein